MKQEQATLDLQEAQLLSPARLEQLAKTLKMVEPAPQAVQYLDGKSKVADAQNRLPLSSDLPITVARVCMNREPVSIAGHRQCLSHLFHPLVNRQTDC